MLLIVLASMCFDALPVSASSCLGSMQAAGGSTTASGTMLMCFAKAETQPHCMNTQHVVASECIANSTPTHTHSPAPLIPPRSPVLFLAQCVRCCFQLS